VASWANKDAIGKAGGVPPLVALAAEGTTETQIDFAVGALASLALDADNKCLIADAGAIAHLIGHVANGRTASIQTLAAVALGK
jgi:hypothetical protein